MPLHDKQKKIASSPARFKTIRAGRKGGKTAFEVENIGFKSTASVARLPHLTKRTFPTGRKVIYVAPTQLQARNIVWEALKRRFAGIGKANEQLLQMKVPNEDGDDTTIYVGGWENRENYRGLTDVIHITFDEVDTLKDFFLGWIEIFRPMFLDTAGTADFIGTPQKENPNLRRLEKEFADRPDAASFHFTSADNPHLSRDELEAIRKEYENDPNAYKQEILAEYVDDTGALFRYAAVLDTFTNAITKSPEKYLIIDVADDGSDATKFSFWEGLEEYRRETFRGLNSESIIMKTREFQTEERIPMSNTLVDAIGVGAAIASASLLDGIVGFKSSYAPIRTETSIVALPNVHYIKSPPLVTEYKNLRSQCIFKLAELVNTHKIASRVTGRDKEAIIEELPTYQDASKGDGKKFATPKEDVAALLGHSPDDSDTWIMRMYFVIRDTLSPHQSEERARIHDKITSQFALNESRQAMNNTK